MQLSQTAWRRIGLVVLAGVLATMYAPVAMVFIYSFNDSRVGSVWGGFSTRWYGELGSKRELWEALLMSVAIGAGTAVISTALGTAAALGLRYWGRRKRRAAIGMLALPLVMPDIMLAVSIALFFDWLDIRQGLTTVILAHTVFGLAYAFVVMAGAVGDLDPTLIDAAIDSGATRWQAFWRVTAPLLAPSLGIAGLLVFALSFDDFLITFLTKGPGTDTLPIEIYALMRRGVRPDTNALFVVLFLVTLAGAYLAHRFHGRAAASSERN